MTLAWSWAFLLLTVALNTGASLLLKVSTAAPGASRLLMFGGSLGCYGLSFLSYYVCLSNFPVSVAYPIITGGAILTIVLAAALLLGEPLTGLKALGAIFVIFGGILLLQQ